MHLTIPTWLTLARIVMIPVLVLVFYLPYRWTNFAAMGVFALASVTDWLDGWIARRFHQYSAFGAFLDPVADKLMVATALFLIVQGHPTAWMALWAAVMVGRVLSPTSMCRSPSGVAVRVPLPDLGATSWTPTPMVHWPADWANAGNATSAMAAASVVRRMFMGGLQKPGFPAGFQCPRMPAAAY